MSMEWWIFTWSVATVEHIRTYVVAIIWQLLKYVCKLCNYLSVLVTEVEESVVTLVIFSLPSKYSSPQLKASRSMFSDFRCTSRLSIVSTWSITLLEMSISEYVCTILCTFGKWIAAPITRQHYTFTMKSLDDVTLKNTFSSTTEQSCTCDCS